MQRNQTNIMVETALMTALAYVLSLIQFGGLWAQGGSISLVMIPIVILAFRRGVKAGITAGLLVGVLKAMLGGTIVHPVQLVLDYPVAYAAIGLAGLFSLENQQRGGRITRAILGITIAALARFVSHVGSGVVWFGSYAPEGMPVLQYSIWYNLSYLLPEVIINSIILIFLISNRYSLLAPK
ncbi:energy-coupled thiamine transporter ThiT [Ammoniphilus sp. CFH 90114]|uniref:energy-coupled thiamine transporter ThiT n=1 Tax=Ammoniphilus sp. CFH 90114 TaxID=2493665 RepID=UPI00100F9F65|nr:energy-coupled thiamine transporter ThiT [Ammoniphilus sp. CFH 90114]RXT06302.1 energy-coupled thiamine transporter ThiT [Ammoniphilus sp. CFH 90114]